jgi:asparagine synthase (glutamine-hydrolysing)
MCGIVGWAHAEPRMPDLVRFEQARDELAERGPDAAATWSEAGVAFGHRRLAILDLTPTGAQPMHSPDGRYVIVYNGEVYNHLELRDELGGPWSGTSDTETILAAYARFGPACVERFHGMFAFAIWDRRERQLFAARDRTGVKPLFYHAARGRVAFASRPRALHALLPDLSRELDPEALRLYLDAGYVPAPRSIFANVRKLEPAHFMVWRDGELRLERYWDPRGFAPESSWEQRTPDDLLDELQGIIERVVRWRLLSDVPLGAFLSGGIDSSVVVSAMRRIATGPVRTFTIGFREPEYDESGPAEAVARHLDTEHHSEILGVDDLLELVPLFAEHYDEPLYDASAFPTLAVSRLARRHVKVSLSGDGGDELFGGYHYYGLVESLAKLLRVPGRRGLARILALAPSHRLRLLAGALAQPDDTRAFAFIRSVVKDFPPVLHRDVLSKTEGLEALFLREVAGLPPGLAPAERGMRLDLRFTLPDDYLQKVDVASMTFSLESREPLLDHDLVEWGMRLPLRFKLAQGRNKWIFRKLAERSLPQSLLDRPKQGFGVPIDRWLRGPLREWASERCHSRELFERVPLDAEAVQRLLRLHLSGGRDAHPLLWSVLTLLEFARRWLT